MFIQSSNRGVVTNSSGASIMALNKKLYKGNINYGSIKENVFSEFDWCILGEEKAKRLYLFAMLSSRFGEVYSYYKNILHKDYYLKIAAEMAHLTKEEIDEHFDYSCVDCEGVWNIDLKSFPIEFYNQMYTFLMRDDVFIYNGNRNAEDLGMQKEFKNLSEEDKNKLTSTGEIVYMDDDELIIPVCELKDLGNVILKQDGDFWVHFTYGHSFMYDPAEITRFSFKRPEEVGLYEKSSVPEIIDLIITDKCDKGCEFCYRDCKADGNHASTDTIHYLRNVFKDSKVFQVAIGGGEPTLHPGFSDILSTVHDAGCMVNFTTYDTAWLNNLKTKDAVLRYVSGIGYSVHNLADIESVDKIRESLNEFVEQYCDNGTTVPTIVAHVVVNSMPYTEFVEILNKLLEERIPVLLLGFKKVGRGKDAPFYELNEEQKKWLSNFIKEKTADYYTISIDVAFTKAFGDVIKEIDLVENTLYVEEGKFTCCINAVNRTIMPSSYSEEEHPFDDGNYYHDLFEIYRKF